ncbi:MAG: hypothetical protein P1P88_04350, partial [Bacteroidales bacterium]|nr:hypothetical protein [Bacteroidales bacterium]
MSAEKQKYDELLREFEAFKKKNSLLLTKKNTELDQLKQALEKSNQAIDAMPVGIVIYDADGKIITNPDPIFSKIYFEKADASSYQNVYRANSGSTVPEVQYFETAPYKGLPAIVPFDLDNGWYAAI